MGKVVSSPELPAALAPCRRDTWPPRATLSMRACATSRDAIRRPRLRQPSIATSTGWSCAPSSSTSARKRRSTPRRQDRRRQRPPRRRHPERRTHGARPTEAFSPEEIDGIFDINVLGTQRVNRASLPHLRRQGRGLVLWISSSSVKAARPRTSVRTSRRRRRWTRWPSPTPTSWRGGGRDDHHRPGFVHHRDQPLRQRGPSGRRRQSQRVRAALAGLSQQVADRLAALAPPEADPTDVARAVVAAVDAPEGKRPYRVHVDPADDGSGVVSAVADHIRAEFLTRVGLGDLLERSAGTRQPRQLLALLSRLR